MSAFHFCLQEEFANIVEHLANENVILKVNLVFLISKSKRRH